MFLYLKAIHIIFIVTWFAGLFYMPRLFVYIAENQLKPEPDKSILNKQLLTMSRRLWYGITWPSAILTLIFGGWVWYLYPSTPSWLKIKLGLVAGLYLYHFSLEVIYRRQANGTSRYTGNQMRIWNEVATILLIPIVMLVVVKNNMSIIYGLLGLLLLIIFLLAAIRIYKRIRESADNSG
ncbi:MAG: CopD family protein [Chitinophagaceae bacterium]|nr:CopD family protein [Chitinophagaceae bacterium]